MMTIKFQDLDLTSSKVLCSNTGQSKNRAMALVRDWATILMGKFEDIQESARTYGL